MSRSKPMFPNFSDSEYHFESRLNNGIIGTTYLAIDTNYLYSATIEKLPDNAEKVTELEHPNIAKHYTFLYNDLDYAFVREYSPIGTLEDVLLCVDQIPESVVSHIAVDIAKALTYLHEKDIYSLNLKPSNLLIQKDGTIKLVDFYFNKTIFQPSSVIVSHAQYCPYEFLYQIKQSDISVLAILCLELVVKRHFTKDFDSFGTFIESLLRCDDVSVVLSETDISPQMLCFVKECMDPNPNKRPMAKELLDYDFLKKLPNEEEYNEFIENISTFLAESRDGLGIVPPHGNELSFAVQKSHVITPNVTALRLVNTGIDGLLDILDNGETAKEEGRIPTSPAFALNQIASFNMHFLDNSTQTQKKMD
ncbi:mitogen-activated protein kinase kinase [Entamoeba marina]